MTCYLCGLEIHPNAAERRATNGARVCGECYRLLERDKICRGCDHCDCVPEPVKPETETTGKYFELPDEFRPFSNLGCP
jgi:hypothetical protein